MPDKKPKKTNSKFTQSPNFIPLAVALIAACAAIASVLITWFLTERIRTEIAIQTLSLELIKVDISKQTLALEKSKVEIAAVAQRTAELAAEMNTKIGQDRLALEKRIAKSTEYTESLNAQIEKKRSDTDEIRLTPEFTKLSNDLRPLFTIDSKVAKVDAITYHITFTFNNKGAHRSSITPTKVELVNHKNEIIPDAIASFDNASTNTVLAGGFGSNTYIIRLKEKWTKQDKLILQFNFKAVTDKTAVDMVKRLSKGVLTDGELSELSVQIYRQNLWI